MYLAQAAFFALGVRIRDRFVRRCTLNLKREQFGANFFDTRKWIVDPACSAHRPDFLIVYAIEYRYVFDLVIVAIVAGLLQSHLQWRSQQIVDGLYRVAGTLQQCNNAGRI